MLKGLEHDRRDAHAVSVIIVSESELADDVFKRDPESGRSLVKAKSPILFIGQSVALSFKEVCPYIAQLHVFYLVSVCFRYGSSEERTRLWAIVSNGLPDFL